MSRRLIAVIGWSAGSPLKENARFREKSGSVSHRSLVLWEDGSGELQRFSVAAVVRRMGGTIARCRTRKAGTKERD